MATSMICGALIVSLSLIIIVMDMAVIIMSPAMEFARPMAIAVVFFFFQVPPFSVAFIFAMWPICRSIYTPIYWRCIVVIVIIIIVVVVMVIIKVLIHWNRSHCCCCRWRCIRETFRKIIAIKWSTCLAACQRFNANRRRYFTIEIVVNLRECCLDAPDLKKNTEIKRK